MKKNTIAFVCFGEINTPIERLQMKHDEALEAVKAVWAAGKYVAAICAGPTVLADLGILTGKNATCYPGQIPNMRDARVVENAACVTDGKVITGTSAGTAVPFALALIEALKGAEAARAIADQIVIR